jgi:glucokinase
MTRFQPGTLSDNAFPFPVLVADLGGTNARFAILSETSPKLTWFPPVQTARFDRVEEAILAALAGGAAAVPRSALLAVAGPVIGDTVRLTNCPWVIDSRRLIEAMGLAAVGMVNDFEALALSLPLLAPGEYDTIGTGEFLPGATKLVVGPGTGLGAAGLVARGGRWIPLPGEGGHIDFAPRTERDAAIGQALLKEAGRVSAETVISGPGLVRLHRALDMLKGNTPRELSPAEITRGGLAGDDLLSVEALTLFAVYFGRYAGDLALIFLAQGGVYLAGGISLRLASFLKTSGFRDAFLDKPPHATLMNGIGTAVITHPSPAITGLAGYLQQPGKFSMDLTGRWWRR